MSTEVKSEVSASGWQLVTATAVLAAGSYFLPGTIPSWLLFVAIGLILAEAVLVLPLSLWVSLTAASAAHEQGRRLRRLDDYEKLLEILQREQEEKEARATLDAHEAAGLKQLDDLNKEPEEDRP